MSVLDYTDEKSSTFLASKRLFTEFLEREHTDGTLYQSKLQTLMLKGETRLYVQLHHLREFDPDSTAALLRRPMAFIAPFTASLRDYVRAMPGK